MVRIDMTRTMIDHTEAKIRMLENSLKLCHPLDKDGRARIAKLIQLEQKALETYKAQLSSE